MKLVLATRNAHKAEEFGLLLPGHEIAPLPDEVVLPPETGLTFTANALIKAHAGPDATDAENLAKLLAEAPAGSALAYVCVIALVDREHDVEVCFEGRCTGVLDDRPRGEGGFGYDPAFRPDDIADGRTMAELSPAEKAAISHRGRAARELAAWLATR